MHGRSDSTTFFIDASVIVDESEFIAVTYSEIANDLTSPTATTRIAFSTDGGATFTVASVAVSQWDPQHLDYHCGRRKFFAGEYREGGFSGHAAYNTFPRSSAMRVTQSGLWSSRAAVF